MDLVIDLDQTLFPLLKAMRLVEGGERVSEDCDQWDGLADMCDAPLDKVIAAAVEPEVAIKVGLYPGAKEALLDLEEAGLFITIATHRDTKQKSQSEEFLSEVGLGHFPFLIGEETDKTEFLFPGGVLIDDAPHLLSAAKEEDILAATLLHPYNALVVRRHNIPSAGSWEELKPVVKSLAAL